MTTQDRSRAAATGRDPARHFEKPERILRADEVCNRIGCGKSKLYLMLGTGEFPQGVRVTARNVGWRESDVEAWIKSRPTVDLRKPSKPKVGNESGLAA